MEPTVLTPAAAAPQDGVTSAATPAPGPSGPLPRGLSLLRRGPAVLRLRVLQRLQRHQQGKSRLYSDNLSTGTFMILHVETVFFFSHTTSRVTAFESLSGKCF